VADIDDTITIRVEGRIEQALTTLTRGGTTPLAAIEQALLDAAARAASAPGHARAPKGDWSDPLSVRRVLTRDQLEQFVELGYLVIPGVIPEELLQAADAAMDAQLLEHPVAEGHSGPHFMFHKWPDQPALAALLRDTPAFSLAEELTGDGALEFPWQIQSALTYPPYLDDRGMPHVDGGMTRKADDPPRTFTMLAGMFLTDQAGDGTGNLFVWPGTHRANAAFYREHGPEAFTPYPDVKLPDREQVRGNRGDLLLQHYLLGHNVGDNTSDTVRRTVYFRLKRRGHDATWRDILQNPWHDFTPLRPIAEAKGM
jgi:Phytanoyl-CoA dioxygenase (PhyH)